MIENYTVKTFVAWWIGAGIGYLLAAVTVSSEGWDQACTVVLVYTLMLYVIYFLLTKRGEAALERLKGLRRKK